MELDIDHLRTWIGREQIATEEATPGLAERLNATLGLKGGAELGAKAPLLAHFCLSQPAVAPEGLGPDGHPARGGFLPPVPLPRRMWAGGAFEFFGDIHIGEMVTRRSVISDAVLKEGRTGRLVFVTVTHHVSADGRDVLRERQDIVYREAQTSSATPPAQPPAPQGEHQRQIDPNPTLLFRYSALTFNGHRIHYDLDWARHAEGYPGLVVHGPLQATLLAQFAETLQGARPKSFSFRSLSTLFHDAPMQLHARREGEALKLWTARPGGPVAMEAEARW